VRCISPSNKLKCNARHHQDQDDDRQDAGVKASPACSMRQVQAIRGTRAVHFEYLGKEPRVYACGSRCKKLAALVAE
jgi:hypothetical protein